MTASSVGLFACRVQPIGLPPAAAANNAPFSSSASNSNISSSSISSRQQAATRHVRAAPSTAAVRRVSRNLFGKPERGEIDQVLRAEYERNCAYVRERYSFDIKSNSSTKTATTTTTTKLRTDTAAAAEEEQNTTEQAPLPLLIAQEMQQQEQAAKRQKKCNFTAIDENELQDTTATTIKLKEEANSTQIHMAYTPPAQKSIAVHNCCPALRTAKATSIITTTTTATSNEEVVTKNCQSQQQKINNVTLCSAVGNDNERHKTNAAKQTLITDCFHMRKTTTVQSIKGDNNNQSKKQQQRELEVLCEPMLAEKHAANVLLSIKITTTATDALTSVTPQT